MTAMRATHIPGTDRTLFECPVLSVRGTRGQAGQMVCLSPLYGLAQGRAFRRAKDDLRTVNPAGCLDKLGVAGARRLNRMRRDLSEETSVKREQRVRAYASHLMVRGGEGRFTLVERYDKKRV